MSSILFTNIRVTKKDLVTGPLNNQPVQDKLEPLIDKVIAQIDDLIEPRIIYRWLDIRAYEKNRIQLQCQKEGATVRLNPGEGFCLLEKAEKCLVAAWTIGSKIENRIKELNRKNEMVESYLFDCAGIEALSKTAGIVQKIARDDAKRSGWGISPLLSPGSVEGWSLAEQKLLCALLDLEKIGLKISHQAVLSPLKSVCGAIGTGPDYKAFEEHSLCQVCSRRKICTLRTIT